MEQAALIKQGLMSQQTHYRSYQGRVVTSQMVLAKWTCTAIILTCHKVPVFIIS